MERFKLALLNYKLHIIQGRKQEFIVLKICSYFPWIIKQVNYESKRIYWTVEYVNFIFADECPEYDIKLSDGESLVLQLWGM